AIDTALEWLVLIALMVFWIYTHGMAGSWISMLAAFLINWFYHVVCELAFHGQSAGKRLMGIRVVRADGSPVTPGASFIRNLLRFADTFMLLNLIALLCISFSKGFRRIGDWAGDTLVVYASGHEAFRLNSMAYLAQVEVVTPPRPLSWEERQAILMFARRYPLLGSARADEIARDYVRALKGENLAGDGSGGESAWLLGIARKLSGGGL
ncbi:MAG: RDD family protein, partial [Spirochaetales bacterium]|nr:RDD family protein [Spirochaetales bacterium]